MPSAEATAGPIESTEVAARADFGAIRYAQVWEDADVLLAALEVRPGDRCLSICSAGDNAIALLVADPAEVVAVDLGPAQLACAALRIAAYRSLEHSELLELVGSRPSDRRWALYERCRCAGGLDPAAAEFWSARRDLIERGIGDAGKFERYFRTFRRWILPLVHRRATVDALLAPRDRAARERFHEERWDTWRWRRLFRIFFSRRVMAGLGRDAAFFRYVEGDVAGRILGRARHALVELDPSMNPYLHWILRGCHGAALPLALRAEHFETIRARIDRVRLVQGSIESVLDETALERARGERPFDRFNLSDIFEYMSAEATASVLGAVVAAATAGARVAYWNMLVPRERPEALADRLTPRRELAARLHAIDRAFFYQRLVIEEVA